MTNSERIYSIAKATHVYRANSAAAVFAEAMTRNDITEIELKFLMRAVTYAKSQAANFAEFHPGEW